MKFGVLLKNTGDDMTQPIQSDTAYAGGSERDQDIITALFMGVSAPSSSVARK